MAPFPRTAIEFLKALFQLRQNIATLTVRDLKARYLGSFLGMTWAVINPLVTILIFRFVFELGFKSAPVEGIPFSLWLTCGIMPWFMISEAIPAGTNAILDSPYLVKKVVFRVSILPLIKILSSMVAHLALLIPVFIIFAAMGHMPGIHILQLPYYMFCLLTLCLGVSWLTSALAVFVRDTTHFVTVALQLLFWTAPILWSLDILPTHYKAYFTYSPLYYLIEGYRNSFIHDIWFWQQPELALIFWIFNSIIFFSGAFVFLRLRPHFADIL